MVNIMVSVIFPISKYKLENHCHKKHNILPKIGDRGLGPNKILLQYFIAICRMIVAFGVAQHRTATIFLAVCVSHSKCKFPNLDYQIYFVRKDCLRRSLLVDNHAKLLLLM